MRIRRLLGLALGAVLFSWTGATWSYFHERGLPFPPVQDTSAFPTCP